MMNSAAFKEKPALIVSAERPENGTERNAYLTARLEEWLTNRRYSFKRVEGCYKGTKESAFFVIADSVPESSTLVTKVQQEYEQETCLYLDSWRLAWLMYKDGRNEPIGQWHSVPEIVAKKRDAYTFDPFTGVYYVCD